MYRRGDRPNSVYYSRKDPAIIIPMILMAAALAWAIEEIKAGRDNIFTFLVMFCITIYIWATLSTRYEVHDDVLVASMAFVRWTIPLNAIVEAFAARGWAPAAPALSRDRLQINYVHRSGAIASLRVSPENGEDFVADLRRTVIRAKQKQGPIESTGSIHSSYMGPAPDEGKISF